MDSVVNENYKDGEKNKLKDEEENAANAEGSEFDDSKAKFINGGKGLEDSQVVVEVSSKDDSFTGLGKEELMQYANDPFWVRTRIILFILFWVGWIAMLAAAIIIIVLAPRCPHRPDQKWWNKEIVYQVYPKSFNDASQPQDGVGDLKGIAEKFEYFDNLTANVLWINPIFESDLVDSGYAVTNHKNISETFGTEAELKEMLKKLHKKGKKVVLDFIPNHTSKNHMWFVKSQKKEGKYANYYVWVPGTKGTPPSNWKSVHGGSAWEFDDVRKEYYLHQYLKREPDLNLTNPDVLEEMEAIMNHWLKMGIDGFHVVGAPYLVESEDVTKNEMESGKLGVSQDDYDYVDHSLTAHQPGSHDLLNRFREIVDSYVKKPGTERLLFTTVKGPANVTLPYLGTAEKKGVHFVLNQALVNLKNKCDGECIKKHVNDQLADKPQDAWTGWTLGNEDSHRFASQVGATYVKAIHTLQMLLPGTAAIYYGDEIGMLDAPVSFNATQDPLGIQAGKDNYMNVSRDPYRTPMRWDGGEKAGFTETMPWLPINDASKQPNVKAQKAVFGGYTTLEYFWQLATIRKEPSFQWGKLTYSVVDKDVFSFIRQAEGFPGFLVAINFGENEAVRTFKREGGEMPEEGQVLVHTKGHGGEYSGTHKLKGQSITLKPGDAFVFKL